MFSTYSKKTAAYLVVALVTAFSVFVVSCQKEISAGGFTAAEVQPDLSTKITSSITGFVTDETDAAVNGATVQAGASTVSTDKYGFFELKNVEVVKNAAVVTVSKPGYFKGIKTYTAVANKRAFFRIKLIPKTTAGTVDASAGGAVTLSSGLSVTLPANGVVVAATGAAYTGQVSVALSWLNPAAADISLIMPGDLRGLDNQGFMKLLKSYGMSAVELTGASGELLQIASGKKATLNFPLPASLTASAPASIPLWYFDETAGLWKEQGSAVKSGNNYTGEVSHFSYWNCDIPLTSSVQFTCTIVDANGNPVPGAIVAIDFADGSYTGAHGITDSSGFINGTIPANAQLSLRVYSSYACGNAIYTQNLTTTTTDLALGSIVLLASSTATVTGNVNDCASTAVSNGYVIMKTSSYLIYRFPVNNAGAFSFNTTLCGNSTPVTFIPVDLATQQAGNVTTFDIAPGANTVGTLIACGTVIDEYINYTINSTPYNITAPADYLSESLNSQSNPATIYVNGNSGTSGVAINTINFQFTEPGIAVGSTQTLVSFYSRQTNDSSTTITTPINVNITEYGAVGQYVAGYFSGTMTGAPPANLPYTITCNFRVKRN